MSYVSDVDLATLHNDCNIGQTLISLPNVTLSPSSLENLLEKENSCLCTLKEILFHLDLNIIDIRSYSKESQVQFLTKLASKRFDWTCFTDPNNTICIKCSLSPDLKIYISDWNVEQLEECASRFMNEANQIPVDVKLHLACLAKDHQCVKDLLKEAHTTDLKKKNMFIFYGISSGEIVDVIVNSGVDVNIKDACGRTPLFYALTRSLNSAEKLLDKGASVTKRDGCDVSVLTFFADNMFKDQLSADVKGQGIRLLSEKLNRAQMIQEVINLILCKFIQVLVTMQPASIQQSNTLNPNMLCEILKTFLRDTHADDYNNLISQLQSIQERIAAGTFVVSDVLQCFNKLGANPSAPDAEGNTCLHYVTQLLFYDVPEETVTDICLRLLEMKREARLDAKNHKKETPLLYCLSSKYLMTSKKAMNCFGCLRKVCTVLIEKGSKLRHTNHKEESAFHLILKTCQYAILLEDKHQKGPIVEEMLKILSRFTAENDQAKIAVRKRDVHLNSPFHLWASLALKSSDLYNEDVYAGQSFENLLKEILRLLPQCEVMVHDINESRQTPLHMCRTWTAVKLLLEAGAKPDVKDSSGCTPLLAAAKRNTCIENDSLELFYPDVIQAPKEFWKEVLDKKLDPWSADKNGNSVLSILIEKEAKCLAKALIEVACESEYLHSDANEVPLLIAVCKDQSSQNHWKLDLVRILVDSRRSLVRSTVRGKKDTPLHFSCKNILQLPESSIETSVHWKIVQYLLLCGADINAAGETGESCLALSDSCPALKGLISTPVDHSTLPLVLGNWKQSSKSHSQQLSLVARMVKYRHVGNLYFYPDALDEGKGSGSFVFAGIDQGGREVAVKRIDKSKMLNKNGSKSVLMSSRRSDEVVQYLFCVKDENFRYIAFELMEGDLEHYLDKATGADDSTKLCKDLVMGLQFLQSQGIVHGNINPRTVFYSTKPNLCFKIGNCKASNSRIGWVAQEVLKGETSYSNESDVFSCSLVLHYLLSSKKHPFAPSDSATKTPEEILNETDRNIRNGNIVKVDDSLSPEATHLVHLMLDSDPSSRPSASDALIHPFFWDNETKKRFLHVVGNEPEISKQERRHPLTAFETDLEGRFNVVVARGTTWYDSPPYDNMPVTYAGMRIRRDYDYKSVAGLIRFIRNAYEHLNEQPVSTQKLWEDDFVLNDYFPHLVIEVYKALTASKLHQLHKSRKEIKKFFSGLKCK